MKRKMYGIRLGPRSSLSNHRIIKIWLDGVSDNAMTRTRCYFIDVAKGRRQWSDDNKAILYCVDHYRHRIQ